MEGQSDAGDPPPEVALAASRRVGPWRKNRCDRHGRGDIFRQRGRQPIADAPASKPIGKSDRREGGVALLVDSLVCHAGHHKGSGDPWKRAGRYGTDRKSTRLNSSHTVISYAVFCLKKKK